MKKHFVNIHYKVYGKYYIFQGLVSEVLNENGKAIVYPCGVFKQAFGFALPNYSEYSVF